MPAGTDGPLVSVCIPSYRGAPHIAAAVRSVLAQSYRNLELIVTDDRSDDGTADIVAGFADRRLRLLRNPANLGAAANWNRCTAEAAGKYVKLLPQDDVLDPECIARQVAVLEADPQAELALVFCARTVVDGKGRSILRRGYGRQPPGRVNGAKLVLDCLRAGTNLIGEPGGILFRRRAAEKAGAFDGTIPYLIDLDYWVRLLDYGDAYYLPQSLVSFRVSSGSWSVAIGRGQSRDFLRFMDRLGSRPGLAPSRLDRARGQAAASFNNLARLFIYRMVLNERK